MAQVKADGSVEDPRESKNLLFWDWFSNLSCLRRRVISGWITQDFEYHFKFELEDEEEEEEKEEEEEGGKTNIVTPRGNIPGAFIGAPCPRGHLCNPPRTGLGLPRYLPIARFIWGALFSY